MFKDNQKALVQIGAIVVFVFFVALILSAGFLASVLWALILGLVLALLLRQNYRITHGSDMFRDIAHDARTGTLGATGSGGGSVMDKIKQTTASVKESATDTLSSDDKTSSASGTTATTTASGAATDDPGGAEEPALSPSPDTPGQKPSSMDAPRDGGPDDLTRISGVGPKLRDMLHNNGYYHFDQIANWSDQEVAWIDDAMVGFKGRASRDNWVGQAKVLAAESKDRGAAG